MGLHRRWCTQFALFCLILLACSFAAAQSRLVEATIHSPGLEHNLLGDPADQPVGIYLPDAYTREPQRHFPVLYYLVGYSGRVSTHAAAESFRGFMDQCIAEGSVRPMIVVVSSGDNKYRGSFYVNSSTMGNWDDFIVRDVVGYVDAHYRTIASAEHRGIAGHSMGGFGALTLGFRHPDVFSVIYALSPYGTDLVGDLGWATNPVWDDVRTMKSPDDVPEALRNNHFRASLYAAITAALAPDPSQKTLGDLPFIVVDGQVKTDPVAYSRIAENMPANMVIPLLPKIAQLRGIFMEYGAQENFASIPIGAQEVSQRLSQAGISNTLEVFQGDHVNHLNQRITERMLPWMSQQIAK